MLLTTTFGTLAVACGDGYQTNLGVIILGEILEVASFIGTPLGAVLAVGTLAIAFFYGRWVLTD